MNQETLSQIAEWAKELKSAVVDASPKVWEAAVGVARVGSVGRLSSLAAMIVLLLVFAAPLGVAAYHSATWMTGQNCRTEVSAASTQYAETQDGKMIPIAIPATSRQVCTGNFDGNNPAHVLILFATAAAAIITAVLIGNAIVQLCAAFDPWVWIGAFRPEVKVTRDIFNRVLECDE